MIGTYDSITGEAGYGFISWLFTPFARTQSKTIKEQYYNGCRFFDLRITYDEKRKMWVGSHGLWKSKRSINEILSDISYLNSHSYVGDNVYVSITLEGCLNKSVKGTSWVLTDKYVDMFRRDFEYTDIQKKYVFINFVNINIKSPWTCIKQYDVRLPELVHRFKTLDGSSWHTFIPIPWLWNKLYKYEYDNNKLNLVDFL